MNIIYHCDSDIKKNTIRHTAKNHMTLFIRRLAYYGEHGHIVIVTHGASCCALVVWLRSSYAVYDGLLFECHRKVCHTRLANVGRETCRVIGHYAVTLLSALHFVTLHYGISRAVNTTLMLRYRLLITWSQYWHIALRCCC